MKTQFTVTASGVPAGSYNATFVGLEAYTENADKFGEGVLLKWQITTGEHKDSEASRICSKKFNSKTQLHKFAKAFKGSDLESGERFDFADYIGTARGMIIVEQTETGSTRVATFLKGAE